jgi:hypothetical protein
LSRSTAECSGRSTPVLGRSLSVISNAVIAPHSWCYGTTGRPVRRPVDDAHLEDADALKAALDALLKAKPDLANRKPRGGSARASTAARRRSTSPGCNGGDLLVNRQILAACPISQLCTACQQLWIKGVPLDIGDTPRDTPAGRSCAVPAVRSGTEASRIPFAIQGPHHDPRDDHRRIP